MSRADAYDAYFHESRGRLLHQIYAYAGNTEVAHHALADAFKAAGQHWDKLGEISDSDSPSKDAWIRARAFRATERGRRSRRPWYAVARETADDHRSLLLALGALEPDVRKLVILHYLVGLDMPTAGREVGVTDDAATEALHRAATTLGARGIDLSPAALTAALQHLSHDLIDQQVDRPSGLRRENNPRRPSYLLLAGAASLALAVGALAITAAQDEDDPIAQLERPKPEPRRITSRPETTPPPGPELTARHLASAREAKSLDDSRPWKLVDSSADFAITEPIDDCVSSMPSSSDAQHLWVRDFSSGKGARPSKATQMLEVTQTLRSARRAHLRLVEQFAGCAVEGHQLLEFRSISGIGDQAVILALRHVDEEGLHDERVAVARSGEALVTWITRGMTAHPVVEPRLVRVLSRSVDSVCRLTRGACTVKPAKLIKLEDAPVPPADTTRGFLTTLDMPLFEGLTQPWMATAPRAFATNPAATECDRADFVAAGAEHVLSRSFVIPHARRLPTYYGMTQTNGRFPSPKAAAGFMADVISEVKGCGGRLRTLNVEIDEKVAFDGVTGRVWRIEVSTAADKTFVFRVTLLRYRETVTQLTYTPAERADTGHDGFVSVVVPRAAQRLAQRLHKDETPAPES